MRPLVCAQGATCPFVWVDEAYRALTNTAIFRSRKDSRFAASTAATAAAPEEEEDQEEEKADA